MDSLLPAGKGFTRLKLQFTYDYLGRRVEKTVTDLDGVLPTTDRRYLYDGWNLVAELDGTGVNVERSYTWGLDMTGTGASAGVGALLQITDNTVSKTYYPTYDGNGNVASLVRADGTVAVTYEYSPFGRLLRSAINPALSSAEQQALATEPFRYSTRFTDTETGLVYYGLRYYSPTLGRFINRDPAEESGGMNLYAFCGNDPLGRWDLLGLSGNSPPPPQKYQGYDAGFVDSSTGDVYWAVSTTTGPNSSETHWIYIGNTHDVPIGSVLAAGNQSPVGSSGASGLSNDGAPVGPKGSRQSVTPSVGATQNHSVTTNGTVVMPTVYVRADAPKNYGVPYYLARNLGSPNDTLDTVGTWNDWLGIGTGTMAGLAGKTTFALYRGIRFYPSGWHGGSVARITTYGLEDAGKFLGYAGVFVSTVIDGIKVYNKQESMSEAAINTGIAIGVGTLTFPADVVGAGGLMLLNSNIGKQAEKNIPNSAWPAMFSGLGGG